MGIKKSKSDRDGDGDRIINGDGDGESKIPKRVRTQDLLLNQTLIPC